VRVAAADDDDVGTVTQDRRPCSLDVALGTHHVDLRVRAQQQAERIRLNRLLGDDDCPQTGAGRTRQMIRHSIRTIFHHGSYCSLSVVEQTRYV
jgi:hypothetical protein